MREMAKAFDLLCWLGVLVCMYAEVKWLNIDWIKLIITLLVIEAFLVRSRLTK